MNILSKLTILSDPIQFQFQSIESSLGLKSSLTFFTSLWVWMVFCRRLRSCDFRIESRLLIINNLIFDFVYNWLRVEG